jgi:toxin ParE1/3/4
MARVIWTEPALQDLEGIADYIVLDKPTAAARFIRRVLAKVELLQKFPQIGSVPAEIGDLPYRQLIVAPCRIFYRIEGKRVYNCTRYETRTDAVPPRGSPTTASPNAFIRSPSLCVSPRVGIGYTVSAFSVFGFARHHPFTVQPVSLPA